MVPGSRARGRRPAHRRPAGRSPRIGPRELRRRGAGRITLRIPVPESIAALVDFGSRHPRAVRGPTFWRCVQQEMEAFLTGRIPEGATAVRTVLDEEHDELVMTFRTGAGSGDGRV